MHLKKKFLLAFLISVISIPIFESAFHHIFHHSHVACTETKIHFHDSKDFCPTCEYNFSPFQLNVQITDIQLLQYQFSQKFCQNHPHWQF